MAKYKQRDDMDVFTYRMDSLERRLENIEKAIQTLQTSKTDVNTELLHMLLGLVKQQAAPAHHVVAASAQQKEPASPVASKAQNECPPPEFSFGRRRTVV